jgi:tetratricopeptide (TPR) repeat protein
MAEVAFREYLAEIDNLIERSSTDQAIQHCRHLLAQHPKAVEVYRLLGKALLEQDDDRAAQDVFQRVLSVDPEDFVARVGLSIVHDRNSELEPAIWHMERAFEIAPSNALIQGELRRLYARREGQSPERIPLTRGALARMYAAGDLNPEAIADLRQLLADQGDRIDLQVQLAEVLWRDQQHAEAAEHAQRVTRTLPFCLKANLILGAILRASGANGESGEPLRRAQAVDPENQLAQQLFSGLGPLYQQSIMVDRLELKTIDQMLEAPPAEAEEVPEWLRGLSNLEQPLLEEPESKSAAALAPGVHMPEAATELPDWLQGLTGETGAAAEAEVPNWLAALTGAAAAGAAVEALSDRKTAPEEVVIQPADEAVPDWITQLGQTGTLKPVEELPQQEEAPDWAAQLRETLPAPFSEQIPAAADTETPDWLAQLRASEPAPEPEPAVGEEPDWLAQLRAPGAQAEIEEEARPDLQPGVIAAGLAGAGAALFVAHEAGEEKAEPTPEPAPVVGEEPDWLARLRAPGAHAEIEEEAGPDLQPGAIAAGLAGAGAALFVAHEAGEEKTGPTPELEQPSDLAQPAASLAAETEQPPTAVAMGPEVPEEMPSADDALAFLAKLAAGKEDQLRAQAEQEADVRMAEIMGRKPAEAAPAAEEKQAPIKMTVPAATVAAVAAGLAAMPTTPAEKPVEPEAPVVVPEEMPSADDALAFLAKLAAGKEDQLRAQAEQEADVRMAEIMGRKPAESRASRAGPEETSAAGLAAASLGVAALAVGAAAQKEEEPPAEVPEELRTQAEQEAEARMTAILAPTAPLEEAPAPMAVSEPEAEAEIIEDATAVAEPTAEAELPDWLKVMRPTEEATAETPVSELPEWLRAMRPTDESPDLGLAALIEEEEAVAPLAETAAAPGEVESESASDFAAELAALERAIARAGVESEAQPPELPQAPAWLPADWWIQTAADTDEEPLPELPQPYLSPRARAAEREKAAATQPLSLEEAAPERRLPQTGSLRQTGPLAVPQTGPLGTPEPAAVSAEVEVLLMRLRQDQQDYAAHLDLARTYWATGDRAGAYAEYLVLVNAGEYTKETIEDLETIVEIYDQTDWHRMLGDVYMKAGRLSSALAQYRSALNTV